MHSTLIVGRMRPEDQDDVARLFAAFDATEMPHLMGTLRRELFTYRGLYFHLQNFATPTAPPTSRKPGPIRSSSRSATTSGLSSPPTTRTRGVPRGRCRHPLLPLVRLLLSTRPPHSPANSTRSSMTRRVVITGIGVIAPGGIGTQAFWNLLTEGRTATRPISLFDASVFRSRIAAEVDFHPEEHGLTAQQARTMDRAAQFAVVATREAMADSGLTIDRPDRVGVVVGSAVGASTSLENQYRLSSDDGQLDPVRYDPAVTDLYRHFVPSSFATDVAWEAGAEGPATVVSTGCTSGLDSVGYAADLVREGIVGAVVVGSTDAPSPPSPRPASTRSRRPHPATTPPPPRPARSTAPATASSSVKDAPCSSSRNASTPGPAAPAYTANSQATPPGPTPTT